MSVTYKKLRLMLVEKNMKKKDLQEQAGLTHHEMLKLRNDMNITKSFSIQEALTPYGVTRNDSMRSAMDFIQTSKHQLPTKKSIPSLITLKAL